MKKIFDYIKLALCVAGVLVGVQIPGFIDQYGNNLDSRVSESKNSISVFQDDADKYFNGDMNQLIKHYENKPDPIIVSGGESIGILVSRSQYLVKALNSFNQSTYAGYIHVLVSPVEEVRSDVWKNYTYKVVLNGSAISIGIVSGLVTLGILELVIFLLGLALQTPNKSRKETRKDAAP